MHRRDIVRHVTLTALGMAMGKYDVFKYKHETVVLTVAEVFQALKDGVQ